MVMNITAKISKKTGYFLSINFEIEYDAVANVGIQSRTRQLEEFRFIEMNKEQIIENPFLK